MFVDCEDSLTPVQRAVLLYNWAVDRDPFGGTNFSCPFFLQNFRVGFEVRQMRWAAFKRILIILACFLHFDSNGVGDSASRHLPILELTPGALGTQVLNVNAQLQQAMTHARDMLTVFFERLEQGSEPC